MLATQAPLGQYILPAHIDSTMLSTARSCMQKFFNEFCCGLRPIDTSIDLHAGGCFSAALERYYREVFQHGLEHSSALAQAYTTFATEWGDFTLRDPRHPKTAENMWAAVESYLAVHPARSDRVQPYFSDSAPSFEFSFAIPLDFPGFPRHPVSGDHFIFTGRFDLFGRLDGQLPCVRDEKTAQRLEASWSEKWDLRSQFLGYLWALQHLGVRCSTVVVRGVIITTKDIRQVEAIKTYPQHLILRWFDALRRDLERIVAAHNEYASTGNRAAWNYNLGDACTAFFKICHFATMCASNTPDIWIQDYVEKRWNPLNRNPLGAPSTIPLQFSGQIPDKYRHLLETAT